MTRHTLSRAVCSAAGALLVVCTAACSDMPSGPRPPGTRSEFESAIPGAADKLMLPNAASSEAGSSIAARREVRAPDGRRYVIESVKGAGGLPRDIRVTRDGQPVAQLHNEWRNTAVGFVLDRQRLVRYVDGGAPVTMDSRELGGVTGLAEGAVMLSHREAAAMDRVTSPAPSNGRLRRLAEWDASSYGPCDAQAAAVEAAIDDWLLSVIATAGATLSSNPFAAWSAYAYQLKKYRDLTRAEAALDLCVANAGKILDEY